MVFSSKHTPSSINFGYGVLLHSIFKFSTFLWIWKAIVVLSSNEKEQLQRYESTGLLVQSQTLTLLLTAATEHLNLIF